MQKLGHKGFLIVIKLDFYFPGEAFPDLSKLNSLVKAVKELQDIHRDLLDVKKEAPEFLMMKNHPTEKHSRFDKLLGIENPTGYYG